MENEKLFSAAECLMLIMLKQKPDTHNLKYSQMYYHMVNEKGE